MILGILYRCSACKNGFLEIIPKGTAIKTNRYICNLTKECMGFELERFFITEDLPERLKDNI